MTSIPDFDVNPPESVDPDEVRCSECCCWVDGLDVDDEGHCLYCEALIGLGGTPGCAAGTRAGK